MVPMIPRTVAVSDKQSQASTLLSYASYQPPKSSTSQIAQVGHIQVPQMVQLPEGLLQRLLASSSCVHAVGMPAITLNSRCRCLLERGGPAPTELQRLQPLRSLLMSFPARGLPGLAWWPGLHPQLAVAGSSVGRSGPQTVARLWLRSSCSRFPRPHRQQGFVLASRL